MSKITDKIVIQYNDTLRYLSNKQINHVSTLESVENMIDTDWMILKQANGKLLKRSITGRFLAAYGYIKYSVKDLVIKNV